MSQEETFLECKPFDHWECTNCARYVQGELRQAENTIGVLHRHFHSLADSVCTIAQGPLLSDVVPPNYIRALHRIMAVVNDHREQLDQMIREPSKVL